MGTPKAYKEEVLCGNQGGGRQTVVARRQMPESDPQSRRFSQIRGT